MRTIKNNLFQRLVAQAEEADVRGLSKVAESLTEQVSKNAKHIRRDDEFYSYSADQLKTELNDQLWSAAVRIFDFYDIQSFNADQLQDSIDKIAKSLVTELCTQANMQHGIGAYEEAVPGQIIEQAAIYVNEDESNES